MKRIKILLFTIISLLTINSCSDDDLPPEPIDYEVEVTLNGDINDFIWTLDLFGRREGAGINLFSVFDPADEYYDLSYANTGDLEPNITYKFLATFADEMSIRFNNNVLNTQDDNDAFYMTINVVIKKGESGTGNFTEITSFSRDYERRFNNSAGVTEFEIFSTKENNSIECNGNYCP